MPQTLCPEDAVSGHLRLQPTAPGPRRLRQPAAGRSSRASVCERVVRPFSLTCRGSALLAPTRVTQLSRYDRPSADLVS